jgi:hypothetical protein
MEALAAPDGWRAYNADEGTLAPKPWSPFRGVTGGPQRRRSNGPSDRRRRRPARDAGMVGVSNPGTRLTPELLLTGNPTRGRLCLYEGSRLSRRDS